MRPKLSKRLLSLFEDQLIESTSSEFNEELYLLYVKGRYQLVTDQVIYSYEDQYDNFAEAFRHVHLEGIQNVLILGYGLGSIPTIFEKTYQKIFSYTAIEIDPEIIRLALKYTIPELKSTVDLIESDAYTYIQYETIKYDLICFDVFINDVIPQKFLNQKYMNRIKSLLKPKGVFVMNMLYLTPEDQSKTNVFKDEVFLPLYQSHKIIQVKANLMLIGWNGEADIK